MAYSAPSDHDRAGVGDATGVAFAAAYSEGSYFGRSVLCDQHAAAVSALSIINTPPTACRDI